MIIGRPGRIRTGRAPARGILLGLLLCAVCWSSVAPTSADGSGTRGLALDVTVNTRPGLGALRPGIRTGGVVVKTYRLTNRSGADLYAIRVRDPALPGARIRCAGGGDRVPRLTGLRSARCTATGRARPGTWVGEATAAGRQPYLRATVRASARSGYAGVGAALALVQTARVTGPGRAVVRYAVTNTGNRDVLRVRVGDAALTPARIACAGGSPVVARIAPGATAVCAAEVRRAPGTYTGRGRAEGTDGLRTLGPRGGRLAPPRLTADASARFTLPGPTHHTTPPSPRPPQPSRPSPAVVAPVPPGAFDVPPEALDEPADVPADVPPVPPGPVPPAAALLAAVPPPPGIAAPGIAPPGVAPPDAVQRPRAPAVPRPPAARRQQARPQGSLLRRFVRQDHTPTGLGLLTALFLVLLPAALAAVLLGSRRN
ncbi:hypothetical protein [Streptomyces sp. VRA16 Mangrove soil]|uniref:hypothetical protein n=1 Tax=Streptomyces sp. VRA16 Mangrove soil TaxID=2817434 RepID=UPI001A9F1630|nr:hypothetical protein [Streptomyces sp. VRA16 Mangrove soil]MBO1331446.1 hypothetical protein [Streptomyces sp. VRA16 Mangrove soil]